MRVLKVILIMLVFSVLLLFFYRRFKLCNFRFRFFRYAFSKLVRA